LAKKIKDKDGDAAEDAFKKGMSTFIGGVTKKLDDYKFYIGEHMNPEGMVVLMGYREDNVTPYFIFFKAGLVEEKYVSRIS
jgi:hypothetical protein